MDKLTVGKGTAVLDGGLAGRTAAEVVLTTTCGATLTFAAGTELRTADGVPLIGPVLVTMKDFRGPKGLDGGITAEAGVHVSVALENPSGMPTRIASATFEPPARLLLPAVASDGPLYLSYVGVLEDGSAWLGKRRPARLAARDQVQRMPVLAGETSVDGSGPVLLDVLAPATSAVSLRSARGATATRSNLIPIPPGDSVQYVRIINAATSQVVGALSGSGSGTPDIEAGETEVVDGGVFTASVVEIDGQRYLEIGGTATGNDLTIQYRLRSQGLDGSPDHREEAPGSGGEEESDSDATHSGFIDITVIGCPSDDEFADFQAIFQIIEGAVDAGVRRFKRTASGYFGQVTADGFSGSVQELAAMLPPEWAFTFGPRRLTIEIPCPPPIVLAASDDTLYALDLDLTGIDAFGALPGPVAALDTGAFPLFGVDADARLVVIDPVTLTGTPTAIAASGVLTHPVLPLVLVTSPEKLTAYHLSTLAKAWTIPLPGHAQLTSPVSDTGGALVFVRAPGVVLAVDVLRRRGAGQLPIPGNGPLAVHPELPLLAALDPGSNQLWIASMPGMPVPYAAGPGPADVAWIPDEPSAMVCSTGADQVRVLPTGPTFGVGDGPTSIAPTAGGVVMVAARNAGKVQRYDGGSLAAEQPIEDIQIVRVVHR